MTRKTSRVRGKLASLISIVSGHEEVFISSSMRRILKIRFVSFGRMSLFIVIEGIAKYSYKWIFFSEEEFLCKKRESFSYEKFFRFSWCTLRISKMKMFSFIMRTRIEYLEEHIFYPF